VDLVTLVAMCSIGFGPEAMRSLIWRQSHGSPWSFSLPSDAVPRVFGTLRDAAAAARAAQADSATIRVGLTGLEVDLGAATAQPNEALFAMCPNVTIASERLRRLQNRCARDPVNADPTWCALAVWRGSWEQPDGRFADAVMLGIALGDVPNPELPSETDGGSPPHATQKEMPILPGHSALSSSLFALPQDVRQRSKTSLPTPDGMFIPRNRGP